MELFEKQLSSRQIFDGRVVKLFVDDIELPNGQTSIREYIKHPGAVCVIPIDEDKNVYYCEVVEAEKKSLKAKILEKKVFQKESSLFF